MLLITITQRFALLLTLGLSVLITPFDAIGQYLPGYVVLANGDTLTGRVMDRKETFIGTELLRKIRFKPASGGRRKKYRPQQLLSYRIDGSIYESHPIRPSKISLLDAYYEIDPVEGEWTFLRVVSRGKINHYQLEWIDQDNDTVESADYFRKENERSLVRATQGIFGLKRKNLIEYFQDCSDLQQKIEQKTFASPAEIADYYNQYCL